MMFQTPQTSLRFKRLIMLALLLGLVTFLARGLGVVWSVDPQTVSGAGDYDVLLATVCRAVAAMGLLSAPLLIIALILRPIRRHRRG